MSEDNLTHTTAEQVHKTHADFFQLAPEGDFVAISFGELQTEMDENGHTKQTEVEYDTKVKMTVESLQALADFIDNSLEDNNTKPAKESRGVQ